MIESLAHARIVSRFFRATVFVCVSSVCDFMQSGSASPGVVATYFFSRPASRVGWWVEVGEVYKGVDKQSQPVMHALSESEVSAAWADLFCSWDGLGVSDCCIGSGSTES